MPLRRCLTCGQLTERTTRCARCATLKRDTPERRAHKQQLYGGDYRKRAAQVRATTVRCWLCGEGARAHDPWQADHVRAGDPASPLAGAHRSCNARRGSD